MDFDLFIKKTHKKKNLSLKQTQVAATDEMRLNPFQLQ